MVLITAAEDVVGASIHTCTCTLAGTYTLHVLSKVLVTFWSLAVCSRVSLCRASAIPLSLSRALLTSESRQLAPAAAATRTRLTEG